ncbi:MAG TPA: hypothetical protein VL307_13325 [Chitinophagaceae bacterium]|nr:hypothetical protein [Chitinophagaceae bacterium]
MEVMTQTEKATLIQQELDELEEQLVMLEGKMIKPSQCYRFSLNPPYVLYNTNCPDKLMEQIEGILLKYKEIHEAGNQP